IPVAGVPLIARAVRAALRSGAVDRVFVSTDAAEIAQVAQAAGAKIIDRPAELSGDTATSESAILHAMDAIEKTGIRIATVVFLQATSPFIPAAGIAEGVALVASGRFDAAFSAFQTYGFLWARDAGEAAVAVNHDASFRP